MSNCCFGAFGTDKAFSASGGGWQASNGLENLKHPRLTRVARSIDLAEENTRFRYQSSSPEPVQMYGFVNHNASLLGEYRVIMYADDAATQVLYDSNWQRFWAGGYRLQDIRFSDAYFMIGGFRESDLKHKVARRIVWMDAPVFTRAMDVLIRDPQNENAYFELGHFSVDEGLQIPVNPRIGARFGPRFNSVVTQIPGGPHITEERMPAAVFEGEIPYADLQFVKTVWRDFVERVRESGTFMFIENPQDELNAVRDAYLARFESSAAFEHSEYEFAGFSVNLLEVIA